MPTSPPYCHKNAGSWKRTFSIRTPPRSLVPVIASTSSSVSSLPFTPPSRSSPPERESNMMAISATGPGDDPATPVSHKTMTNRVSTKKYGRRRRDARCGRTGMANLLLLLRVPTGAPRPRNPVYPRATYQRRPSPSTPSESTSSEPPRQCDRDMTRWTSYPSTPLPPLHDHHLLGAARARPRNRGDRCS
ncbi:hypothetical protein EDB85DRAFT_1923582 [Lactarius pseudohatsudake]|nr:hypothetical protein EDB85DRAFT_1923582 [Lactarius pseudohatsudake]